jgi:hypothetical protein
MHIYDRLVKFTTGMRTPPGGYNLLSVEAIKLMQYKGRNIQPYNIYFSFLAINQKNSTIFAHSFLSDQQYRMTLQNEHQLSFVAPAFPVAAKVLTFQILQNLGGGKILIFNKL